MSAQSAKSNQPPFLLVVAGMACVPLLAGLVCCLKWSDYNKARNNLSELIGTEVVPVGTAAGIALADAEKAAINEQIKQLAMDLEIAGRKQMPVNTEATRQMTLDILDLAGRCGLGIEEVNRLSDDPRTAAVVLGLDENIAVGPAAVREGVMAFINRYSINNVRRPIIQLQCRGPYGSIQQFFTELGALRWKTTPIFFEIGHDRPTISASPESDMEGSPQRQGSPDGDLLKVKVLVAM